MDDFNRLGLGSFTCLITKITISSWGKDVLIDCTYHPDERLPFRLVFLNCREIKWLVDNPENSHELEADIIDFQSGESAHRQPAFFYTDIFQLWILYEHLRLDKDW